jgi:hypothetical protein
MSQQEKILTCGIAAGFLYAIALLSLVLMVIGLALGESALTMLCLFMAAGLSCTARFAIQPQFNTPKP